MSSTKRPLTRDRILQEGIALADEAGPKALSMRKLAQRLGVEAMSLYNHVKNKDDLVGGMVDHVAAEIRRPGDGPWREEMRARALSAHAVLMRHPWAAQEFLSRVTTGPNMLGYVDATLACLTRAGFSYPMADHVWNTVDAYVFGFTIQRLSFPFRPEDHAAAARAYKDRIPENLPHLRALTGIIAEGEHDGIQHIEMGLDLLLDGFERMRVS